MTSDWTHNLVSVILSEFRICVLLQLTVDSQLPGVLQGPVLDHGVLSSAGQHPLVIPVAGREAQHGPGDVAHLVADVGRWPDEAVSQPPGDDWVRPEESSWQTRVIIPATPKPGSRSLALYHVLLADWEWLPDAGDADVNRGEDHVYLEAPGQRGRDVVVPGITGESHSWHRGWHGVTSRMT